MIHLVLTSLITVSKFTNPLNIVLSSNPLHSPKQQILDSSKLKEFAEDNFELDEKKPRKFSKQVENTVGKGEFASYEQFLLFPQCFQKTCTAGM